VRCEIINTGTELMLGRVLNTHQQWLCRQLADAGHAVDRQVAVADTADAIVQAVHEALGRADLVVTTGGLGPTSDDFTRQVIAGLFGLPLAEDPAAAAHIDRWFTDRGRVPPPGVRVQALVPAGATVLPNAHGTAPGLRLATRTTPPRWLVMLPGPPRELRPMFLEQVLPWIGSTFPAPAHSVCRTLRSTGIGESSVQALLSGPLTDLVSAGLEIGYCCRPGEVDIRFMARGAEAARLVAEAETRSRTELGPAVYGIDDDTLEAAVVGLLARRPATLSVAESCTGGLVASRITDVPGASAVFRGGAVVYSNDLKQQLLGVRGETLAAHGAVSEPTAREMAEGARRRLGSDFALALTGIAGPSGETAGKPVGTVFIALATPAATRVEHHLNRYDRGTFKQVASQQALELLRQHLVS